MSVDTSMEPLDLEHELPSVQKSGGVQRPNRTSGEVEGEVSNFVQDPQNDDNDPAKLRERLVQLRANFENARKRSFKEQQELWEYAEFDTAKPLLLVLDSLEQALKAPLPKAGTYGWAWS